MNYVKIAIFVRFMQLYAVEAEVYPYISLNLQVNNWFEFDSWKNPITPNPVML